MNALSPPFRPRLVAVLAVLLAGPVLAQESAQPLPSTEGEAPPEAVGEPHDIPQETLDVLGAGPALQTGDPHSEIDELIGGPDGTPTARRGSPSPGTSTAIPTLNPAPVRPLELEEGEDVVVEDTGIEGQCDPNVRIGNCPELAPSPTAPDELEGSAAVEGEASAGAAE